MKKQQKIAMDIFDPNLLAEIENKEAMLPRELESKVKRFLGKDPRALTLGGHRRFFALVDVEEGSASQGIDKETWPDGGGLPEKNIFEG